MRTKGTGAALVGLAATLALGLGCEDRRTDAPGETVGVGQREREQVTPSEPPEGSATKEPSPGQDSEQGTGGAEPSPAQQASPPQPAAASGQPAEGTGGAGQPSEYVVQQGDTLFEIASEHEVALDDLVRANDIEDPNRIEVGQTLTLP